MGETDMRFPRSVGVLVVCLGSLIGVGAVSGASPAAAAAAKPVLSIALATPPTSLDPLLGSGVTNGIFQAPAYQGLLHLVGNGGTLEPSLAASYKWIGDNNSKLEVVLHSGLKFADGTPLNAAAVKTFALAFASGTSPFAYVGQEVASSATPNNLTDIFTLKAPDLSFATESSDDETGLGNIVSPEAINQKEDLQTSTDGAGPYELSQSATVEGSTYTYTPNPNYFDTAAVKFSKIVIRVIADPNTAVASIESGQVQVAYGAPDTVKEAQSDGIGVAAFPGSVDALFLTDDLGTLNPALKNVDVRKAINYAIDRPAIAKAITLGAGAGTDQMPITGTLGYSASLANAYPYNLAKAKQLMAAGGYAHGFTLTVTVPSFMSQLANLDQVLTTELAKIGITVQTFSGTTFPSFIALQNSGNYDSVIFSFPFPEGLPSAVPLLFSAAAVGNPRHEILPDVLPAAQAAEGLGGAKGAAAWLAINKTIVSQALEAPVETEPTIYYYAKSVRGVPQSLTIDPDFMSPSK